MIDLLRPEVPYEVAEELLGPEFEAQEREEAAARAAREARDVTWYGDRPQPEY